MSYRKLLAMLPFLAAVGLAGCDTEGPMEEAGEEVDQTMERAQEQMEEGTEGAQE